MSSLQAKALADAFARCRKIKKNLVETALVAALSAALNAVLEFALADNDGPSDEVRSLSCALADLSRSRGSRQEMEAAFVTMDSLVAAACGLVVLKGEGASLPHVLGAPGLTIAFSAHLRLNIHHGRQSAMCWAKTSRELSHS